MKQPFKRLAIVNRGEPAMRLIHAVRELNEQRAEPIRLIALYTEGERDAMFVRHADDAASLGRVSSDDPEGGGYLDHVALERALVQTRADAAWVGWGFVAEQPAFADLCARLGIVFVGPDPAVMRLVGDKIAAKRLAESAGVPVAPWSGGAVATYDDAGVDRLSSEAAGLQRRLARHMLGRWRARPGDRDVAAGAIVHASRAAKLRARAMLGR